MAIYIFDEFSDVERQRLAEISPYFQGLFSTAFSEQSSAFFANPIPTIAPNIAFHSGITALHLLAADIPVKEWPKTQITGLAMLFDYFGFDDDLSYSLALNGLRSPLADSSDITALSMLTHRMIEHEKSDWFFTRLAEDISGTPFLAEIIWGDPFMTCIHSAIANLQETNDDTFLDIIHFITQLNLVKRTTPLVRDYPELATAIVTWAAGSHSPQIQQSTLTMLADIPYFDQVEFAQLALSFIRQLNPDAFPNHKEYIPSVIHAVAVTCPDAFPNQSHGYWMRLSENIGGITAIRAVSQLLELEPALKSTVSALKIRNALFGIRSSLLNGEITPEDQQDLIQLLSLLLPMFTEAGVGLFARPRVRDVLIYIGNHSVAANTRQLTAWVVQTALSKAPPDYQRVFCDQSVRQFIFRELIHSEQDIIAALETLYQMMQTPLLGKRNTVDAELYQFLETHCLETTSTHIQGLARQIIAEATSNYPIGQHLFGTDFIIYTLFEAPQLPLPPEWIRLELTILLNLTYVDTSLSALRTDAVRDKLLSLYSSNTQPENKPPFIHILAQLIRDSDSGRRIFNTPEIRTMLSEIRSASSSWSEKYSLQRLDSALQS